MYPYQFKIKEPNLIKIYLRLEQDHIVKIPEDISSKKITWQLKPIRPDIFLGRDRRYNDRYIALKPDVKLKMVPLNAKKTSYKIRFDKMF